MYIYLQILKVLKAVHILCIIIHVFTDIVLAWHCAYDVSWKSIVSTETGYSFTPLEIFSLLEIPKMCKWSK